LKRRCLIAICLSLALTYCKSSGSTEKLPLKDFKFEGYFGYKNGDKNSTYCLLGQGFFRTPRSANSDSLLNAWYKNHPDAKILVISTFATPDKNNPDLNLKYCWAIDGQDTLNNYLIRNGCYPGGTMQRPQTWEEMPAVKKAQYENGDKPSVTVAIDKKTYDAFIEQIKSAETFARNNKLGIWATENSEE
jgi:hypothetical protein